jgi:hypothetical protein
MRLIRELLLESALPISSWQSSCGVKDRLLSRFFRKPTEEGGSDSLREMQEVSLQSQQNSLFHQSLKSWEFYRDCREQGISVKLF